MDKYFFLIDLLSILLLIISRCVWTATNRSLNNITNYTLIEMFNTELLNANLFKRLLPKARYRADVMHVCMHDISPVSTYSSGASSLPLVPGETGWGGRMGASTCRRSASLVGGLAPQQKGKKKCRLCIWQMAKLRQAHGPRERIVPEVAWICLQNKSFWPAVWRH